MTSPGIRSGVNWTRPKPRSSPPGEGLDQQGLGGPRDSFQQDVALHQQGNQKQVDGGFLTDDGLANLGA